MRLCSRLLQSSWRGSSAASGIATTSENRPRKMIRQAQFSRGDKNQEFRIPKRIPSPSERVSCDWDFSEAGQAGDGTCFLRIGEAPDQGRFVLLNANGLRQRAIGNDGNPVHAGAG